MYASVRIGSKVSTPTLTAWLVSSLYSRSLGSIYNPAFEAVGFDSVGVTIKNLGIKMYGISGTYWTKCLNFIRLQVGLFDRDSY